MMVKKGILLIMLIIASVSMENSGKEEMERDAKSDMITGDYCGMDEFEELNYYLFCDSQLHEGAGGFTFKPSIISSETKTIEEAKQLYQEFMERLPLDSMEEGEENNAFYVSPDCKWVITNKWYEHKTRSTQMLFYEKEKVREKENDWGAVYPILIVKDGNSYREMDKEQYEKLLEMEKITFYDGGYDCFNKINTEGNLFAEIRDEYNLLTIRDIEEGAEQWSFSLQGIQEEVARIRDDIKEGDTVLVTVQQFEGNEKEGWLTVQAGLSSFFRIAYPSGEVTYLGEYMYSVCFSPDGKYAAYSSDVDYDDGVVMENEKHDEYERMKRICPPGICVREIETGKTAYLYWDPAKNPEENYMEYRHFMWIEKEGFEEYMGSSLIETEGEKDYCSINDFEGFHYYLFCNTNINLGTTPKVINAFIGNEGETMETGIELYQKFMEPLRTDEHEENMELYYISPDCKLAVTREEPVRGDHMITRWSSFDGGEAQNVKEIDSRDRTYFHITKSGDTYTVVDGETFNKKEDRLYEQTGYYCVHYNEQGDLGVGYKYEYDELGESTQKMAIFDLESTEVLWTFYQGEEKDGYVWQIQGDKESGKVIFDVENRYYYEFTYPSGEIRYLGTDMYCPCYSPDGKYIAYSSPCSADWNDVDEKAAEEMERILPGIYILEVETGKTAYIKQDMNDIHWAATLEFRSFQWVEKDCFERVMKERDAKTDMTTGNYCGMDEFEELNYYLFCDSQLHEGAGGFTFRPSIIGSETQTIEEAKQLYQEFAERLPLDFEEKETECDITYVSDVSPDCKCVITSKWSEYETMRTQILFYEKEKVREEVNEIRVEDHPMLIVKDGDSYREMDEEHYEMLSELKKESYDEGYLPIWRINAEGNLLAGVRDNSLLTIREIEEGAERWSFSVQGIQEEVAQIRDDVQEEDFLEYRCFMWIEKEGFEEYMAGSRENEEFVKRVNERLLIIMDTVVEQLVMRMKS